MPNFVGIRLFRSSADSIASTNYFNGLGNETQRQLWIGSGDMITATTYDAMGRVNLAYKTYQDTLSTSHAYDPDFSSHASAYYPQCGSYPYGRKTYEVDPGSRVTAQFYPGQTWGDPAENKYTRLSYGTNGSEIYGAWPGTLSKTKTIDENGHTTASYVDFLGHKVADIVDSSGLNLVTWFDNDIMGRVKRVFPPQSYPPTESRLDSASHNYDNPCPNLCDTTVRGLGTISMNVTQSPLLRRLTVDLTVTHGPPKGEPLIVLSTFGIQAWYTVKQYAGSTLISTWPGNSIYNTESGTSLDRSDLFELSFSATRVEVVIDSIRFGQGTERALVRLWCSCLNDQIVYSNNMRGQLLGKFSFDAGRVRYRYDARGNLRFQQDSTQSPASKFTYKKYDRMNRLVEVGECTGSFYSVDSTTTGNPANDFPTSGGTLRLKNVYDSNISGDASARKLLGRLSCVVTDNNGTRDSVFYSYDEFGRVEWQIHRLGGLSGKKVLYEYDWQGNITKLSYLDLGKSSNNTYFFYEYDKAGRLAKSYSGVNSSGTGKVQDAEYTYLGNGQVQRLKLGSAQGVDYVYNERDWLRKINDTSLTTEPGGLPSDKFGMAIGYNESADILEWLGGVEQYNGNISWIGYSMSGVPYSGAKQVGNTYLYDAANRITKAEFGYRDTRWRNTSAYDEPGYAYDKNGNITRLKRYGVNGTVMDSLTYHYTPNTNRLSWIDDTVAAARYAVDIDDQVANNYLYDANGSMIKNVQGQIDTVKYDWRNLPLEIKKSGITTTYRYNADGSRVYKSTGGGTRYIYDAQGRALAVIVGTADPTFNLWGNHHIGQLQVTYGAQAGGGAAPLLPRTDNRYYFLKDHLGSVKVTVDASGNVSSWDDFYAFGMQMEGRSGNVGQGDARYKFTTKERDAENGYDYFGARYYDSKIGRWLAVDKSRAMYPSWSPYQYTMDNPIVNFDPNGKWVITIHFTVSLMAELKGSYSYGLALDNSGKIGQVGIFRSYAGGYGAGGGMAWGGMGGSYFPKATSITDITGLGISIGALFGLVEGAVNFAFQFNKNDFRIGTTGGAAGGLAVYGEASWSTIEISRDISELGGDFYAEPAVQEFMKTLNLSVEQLKAIIETLKKKANDEKADQEKKEAEKRKAAEDEKKKEDEEGKK